MDEGDGDDEGDGEGDNEGDQDRCEDSHLHEVEIRFCHQPVTLVIHLLGNIQFNIGSKEFLPQMFSLHKTLH